MLATLVLVAIIIPFLTKPQRKEAVSLGIYKAAAIFHGCMGWLEGSAGSATAQLQAGVQLGLASLCRSSLGLIHMDLFRSSDWRKARAGENPKMLPKAWAWNSSMMTFSWAKQVTEPCPSVGETSPSSHGSSYNIICRQSTDPRRHEELGPVKSIHHSLLESRDGCLAELRSILIRGWPWALPLDLIGNSTYREGSGNKCCVVPRFTISALHPQLEAWRQRILWVVLNQVSLPKQSTK